jgi:hypothetical protein
MERIFKGQYQRGRKETRRKIEKSVDKQRTDKQMVVNPCIYDLSYYPFFLFSRDFERNFSRRGFCQKMAPRDLWMFDS